MPSIIPILRARRERRLTLQRGRAARARSAFVSAGMIVSLLGAALIMQLGGLSMASVGYQSGISAARRSPAMLGVVLGFAAVLFMIADLDRSHEGFLSVSQQAMVDLQTSMETAPR